jgi:hypothetical protein
MIQFFKKVSTATAVPGIKIIRNTSSQAMLMMKMLLSFPGSFLIIPKDIIPLLPD